MKSKLQFRLRLGAVIAGFLASNVCTVLSIAAVTLIFPRVMAGVDGGIREEALTVFVSAEALTFGLCFSVLGGWVIARLASQSASINAANAALAAVVQLLIFYPYDSTAPVWYCVALLLLTVPAYLLGVRINLLTRSKRDQDASLAAV